MKVFSNRFRIPAILAVAAAILIWACQAAASPMKDVERLMPPRTVLSFFEGQEFADLVLNARGKLTFLYVDRRLADALRRLRELEYSSSGPSSGIPSQVFAYATKSKRRHVLFITRVQPLKRWTFDPSLLSVGGYSPVKEDIITGISDNPSIELKFGEINLNEGYNGYIGFFVPAENVKPGETINLGYAEDLVEWQVPN